MRVAGCDVAHPLGRGASGLVTRCVLLPASPSSGSLAAVHSYVHGTDAQPIAAKFFHEVSSDGGAQGEADALTALASPSGETHFVAEPFYPARAALVASTTATGRLYRFVELGAGSRRREVAHGHVDLRGDIRTVRFENDGNWTAVRARLEVPLVNGTAFASP
jgi:hypothetical protein